MRVRIFNIIDVMSKNGDIVIDFGDDVCIFIFFFI